MRIITMTAVSMTIRVTITRAIMAATMAGMTTAR